MENTPILKIAMYSLQKHPHIYGEYNNFTCFNLFSLETPPYIWRILFCSFWYTHTKQKHPHIYGEYATKALGAKPAKETPPYIWRIQGKEINNERLYRNTPIYMENTAMEENYRWAK